VTSTINHDIYYTPHAPDNHLLALLALMERMSRKRLRSRPDVDRMVKLMTLAKRPDAADALANVNFSRGLPSNKSPGKPKHGGGRLKHKVMASPPNIDYRPSCATSMALVLRDADTLGGVRARKKPALFDPDLDGLSDRHKLQRLQDEAERNHEDESPSALSTCGSAASDSVRLIGQRVSGMPVRGYGKHNGKISAVCGATDCQIDWDDGTSSWVSRSQAMKYLEKQPEPIRITCQFFRSSELASHAPKCTAARVEPGCDAAGAGSELRADQPDAHMDAGDSHASAATPAQSESLDSSTSAAQSSCGARATLCGAAEYGVLGRDTRRNLNKLRTWVGGLERIGDAEQVVALLVQSEVSLDNLKLLTVDELAATGVGEAVACELLSQLSSLEQSPRGSPIDE
jgi:hypothetical protein